MPDDELAAAAGRAGRARARAARRPHARRGARDRARRSSSPRPVDARAEDAGPTLERFVELRGAARGVLDEAGARAIVRELKAVGGDLRALRLALTGAERGPELWTVVAALPRDEALARGVERGRYNTAMTVRLYDT